MASQNDMEVEADRKAAEDSGCSVTLRSNNTSFSDQDKSNEIQRQSEEETTGRGRGRPWAHRRPRGPRARPRGHFSQGSERDGYTADFESSQINDPDKLVSAGFDPSFDHFSSPHDRETYQPPEGSHLPSHNSSYPTQYSSQESREGTRGQRSAGGRGHSRPKYVTVPDASHSRDVRHVEQVNDSIVINIDRSTKPVSEPVRRGRGGARGAGGRSDFSTGMPEDGTDPHSFDRDAGIVHGDSASHQRGYHGRGGRRPFRGQGDGSYRGQGRGDGGYRRGRGDGPRPFRGGYSRGERARGGRGARRAVIHVVTSSGSGLGSSHTQEEEDATAAAAAAETGAVVTSGNDQGWPSGEDGGVIRPAEHQVLGGLEGDGSGGGHFCDDSRGSGVHGNKDGVDPSRRHDEEPDRDNGEASESLSEKKEIGEQDSKPAESTKHLPAEAKEPISKTMSKDVPTKIAGVKVEGINIKQNSVPAADESANTGVKVGDIASPDLSKTVKDAPSSGENARSDSVAGKITGTSNETTNASKETKSEKPAVNKTPDAVTSNSSTAAKSNESELATGSSAEVSNPSVVAASNLDSSALSSGAVLEIPASADAKT